MSSTSIIDCNCEERVQTWDVKTRSSYSTRWLMLFWSVFFSNSFLRQEEINMRTGIWEDIYELKYTACIKVQWVTKSNLTHFSWTSPLLDFYTTVLHGRMMRVETTEADNSTKDRLFKLYITIHTVRMWTNNHTTCWQHNRGQTAVKTCDSVSMTGSQTVYWSGKSRLQSKEQLNN